MGNNQSFFRGEVLPVEQVSWGDCQAFCEKAGLQLPTEAQWEYACRGGTTGPYAGTGNIDDMGWYGESSTSKTHPIGRKKANGFGLYDMHGNIWEWRADAYDQDFYFKPEASGLDPVCTSFPDNAQRRYRVGRGGSHRHDPWTCTSFRRSRIFPTRRYRYLGLRPCRFSQ